jgi:phosphoglycolate phosphatase
MTDNKKKVTFVFDLDGTLVDTARINLDIIFDMLSARGGSPSERSAYLNFMSTGGEDLVGAVLGNFSTNLKMEVAEFRERLRTTVVPADHVYDGIISVLNLLKSNQHKIGVCTNKPQYLAEKTLFDVSLGDYFDCVVGSNPSRPKKPDIEMMEEVDRILNCNPSEVIFVGDSEIDHQTAHNYGARYIHLNHGYGNVDLLLTQPLNIFDRIDEAALRYFATF